MREFQDSSQIFKDLSGLKLWEARHSTVLNFIEQKNIRTMLDLGTSEASLMQKVQRGIQVQHLIGLDIDQQIIPKAIENLAPQILQLDLQYIRQYDQYVQLYHGSALQKYPQLKKLKIDLISLIEVIQHIEERHLDQLNENVFGYLKPTFVFMSTPNSDFNPLFKWQAGRKFRHDDHKFQWSRLQFGQYVERICEKYNYKVTITGVGESIFQEHRDKGFCSQIAIFENLSFQEQDLSTDINYFQLQKGKKQEHKVPLRLVLQHTNFSWISLKDYLLDVGLKQITKECQANKDFISWSKAIKEFKKKTIVRKLTQIDDKWKYDYFLKNFISSRLNSGNPYGLIFSDDGITKLHSNEEDLSSFDIQNEFEQNMQPEQIIESHHEKFAYDEVGLDQENISHAKLHQKIINDPNLEFLSSKRSKNRKKTTTPSQKSHSSSCKSSSSSRKKNDDSWDSIEIPDDRSIKKVTKKKRGGFRLRKKAFEREGEKHSQ